MTAWATEADITDRYGSQFLIWIADRNKDGTVDSTAVTKALNWATSRAQSYVGTKFPIDATTGYPGGVSTLPDSLVDAVVDLAAYRLAGHDAGSLSEEHTNRYKDAIKWLEAIASGKATLGIASPPSTIGHATILSSSTRQTKFADTPGLV